MRTVVTWQSPSLSRMVEPFWSVLKFLPKNILELLVSVPAELTVGIKRNRCLGLKVAGDYLSLVTEMAELLSSLTFT